MLNDDPRRGRAQRARGIHEITLAKGQQLAAYKPGKISPVDEPDRQKEHHHVGGGRAETELPQRRLQRDLKEHHQQDVWQAIKNIDRPHEQRIDPPASIPCQQANARP